MSRLLCLQHLIYFRDMSVYIFIKYKDEDYLKIIVVIISSWDIFPRQYFLCL